MTTGQLRRQYAFSALPLAVLEEPTAFYNAFSAGEEEVQSFATEVWERLCRENGDTLREHPFFPDSTFWLVDETEENFACMWDLYLPAVGATPALYAAVVFGATMDPRCFAAAAAADGGADIAELTLADGGTLKPVPCGRLDAALPETERRQAFMERVYAVCDAYSSEA